MAMIKLKWLNYGLIKNKIKNLAMIDSINKTESVLDQMARIFFFIYYVL